MRVEVFPFDRTMTSLPAWYVVTSSDAPGGERGPGSSTCGQHATTRVAPFPRSPPRGARPLPVRAREPSRDLLHQIPYNSAYFFRSARSAGDGRVFLR